MYNALIPENFHNKQENNRMNNKDFIVDRAREGITAYAQRN